MKTKQKFIQTPLSFDISYNNSILTLNEILLLYSN